MNNADISNLDTDSVRSEESVARLRRSMRLRMGQAVSRGLNTLRYHRLSQLLRRSAKVVRQRSLRARRGGRYAEWPEFTPTLREGVSFERLAERRLATLRDRVEPSAVDRLRERRPRFLGREVALGSPVDWALQGAADVGRLWRFHLHYHEWLVEAVAAAGDRDAVRVAGRAWEVVAEWIEAARLSEDWAIEDAWHPFCISRRVPAWLVLWQIAEPPGELREKVLESLLQQLRFLADHLEFDLGGNHLLENLRALLVGATFLEGPEAQNWLELSEPMFVHELDRQVLPHGEHFERSAMYHASMLEAVLDVRDATGASAPELSETCAARAREMAAFLEAILHPDGRIPLLGDAAFDATPSPRMLIEASFDGLERGGDGARSSSPTIGPYMTWRRGGDYVCLDAGDVAADDLPAHAHCDLSNVEMSVAGQRLFVDSGVYGYEDDEMRGYCRSTAAHNVLEIDGINQCDVWSRFRMGFRGRTSGLEYAAADGVLAAWCSHDGYRQIGVPFVGREVVCHDDGVWIVVDAAVGRGERRLVNRLHVHPGWRVEQIDRVVARLTNGAEVVQAHGLGPGELRIGRSWYCPEFGHRVARPVLEWVAGGRLPWHGGWLLVRGDEDVRSELVEEVRGRIAVVWTTGRREVNRHRVHLDGSRFVGKGGRS